MTNTPNTPKKILLVDDDRFLLDMYAIKFSKSGYEVKTADATNLALQLIKDGYKPDIILADVVMPGMDGLEMISFIKENKIVPDATIIMLTNQGSSDDIGRARKLNVDGYIVKATTVPSEVLREVENVLITKKPI
ncbi:MAG: response regulator [Candidatus Taylorbacteria bacterium]